MSADAETALNWNCEMEVNLLHAVRGHKPVGVNRHFQMLFIHDKLTSTYKKLSVRQIWDYLGELYDLNALNESEILPFPNKEIDFSLPTPDYSDVVGKGFPRLIAPKQSETKTEIKQEKLEKQEKHEKPDKSDAGSTKSSRSDSRQSTGTPVLSTPDNSPKRKRTRHTPSVTPSPATPDAPPTKRRR